MDALVPRFEFEYNPGKIVYGRGCVDRIGSELARRGLERALVVCGSNVGSTPAVMDPVTEGIGDRLAGVFDETSPAKYVGTAYEGAEIMRERGIDALVSLGGGSSLDTAKAMSALAPGERSLDDAVSELESTGRIDPPSTPLTPIMAVPTTLAGADITDAGGINLTETRRGRPGEDVNYGVVSDPRLMPAALFYDPELFATTPRDVLTSSAMNGFDKGIDTLYSRAATPITDATMIHGLGLLRDGLPDLAGAGVDDDALDLAICGTILVQYGKRTNIVHAFGHGFSFYFDVQQGTVHGITAPHVLRYVFESVDGRRDLIAEGLGIEADRRTDGELADAIVDTVARIRDDLGLPARLRTIDGLERDHLSDVAGKIAADPNRNRNPPGLDPTPDDIEAVLWDAW